MTKTRSKKFRHLLLAALTTMATLAPAFAEGTPDNLEVGAGKAKFDSLLQFWGLNDSTNDISAKFNFRLRRAEMKFTGSVAEGTSWFLMVDPAKNPTISGTGTLSSTNDNKILQDMGINFRLSHNWEMTVGQFKAPAMAEGLDSSSELLLPERTYATRLYGYKREPGGMLTFRDSIWKASLMISNGQKPNVDDVNDEKDLTGRLEVTPLEQLKIGAFTTAGDFTYKNKARWGVNARGNIGSLLIRAEGVKDRENSVNSLGLNAHLAYSINEHFQPVLGYEIFDNSGFTARAGSAGVNYLISKNNSKIQAGYWLLDGMKGANGSYVPARGVKGSLFILSFQAAI